ncbi:thioesterase II family protein [Lentzea sp. NPDC004789]
MSTRWLLRAPDPAAERLLLCLPVSGLGATTYRDWPAHIGTTDVVPVQPPGRENRTRERPHTTMAEFAAAAADELLPVLDRPYALFGHCLGGRLGYALAVALAERGAPPPQRLFASSCLAPHQGGRFGPFLPEMTDDEYLAELRRGCERRGEVVPPDELLALAVRVLRVDVELSCGYAPPGPAGDPLAITTIGWTGDTDVDPGAMTEWGPYGEIRHVVLDGDEFSFRAMPERLHRLLEAELTLEASVR